PAGGMGLTPGRADRAAVAEIAREQALDAAHAAVDEDQVEIGAVLLIERAVLGEPVDDGGAGRVGDVGDISAGGVTRRGEEQRQSESENRSAHGASVGASLAHRAAKVNPGKKATRTKATAAVKSGAACGRVEPARPP